jgi:hypothetical protein
MGIHHRTFWKTWRDSRFIANLFKKNLFVRLLLFIGLVDHARHSFIGGLKSPFIPLFPKGDLFFTSLYQREVRRDFKDRDEI